MPLAVLERPPLFVFRRVGEATADDFRVALERLRTTLEVSPERVVAIYDAGTDSRGSPDATARKTAATWIAENAELTRRKLAALEFVSNNPVSRGVLTAIFWLRSPPFETHFHARIEDAITSASRILAVRIDPTSVRDDFDRRARSTR